MKVGKKGIFKFIVICVFLVIVTASHLFATEYIGFSLKIAQEKVLKESGKQPSPDVFYISGITKIFGLVYDQKNNDLILVGVQDKDRPALTLDDFAVALRAVFIHEKWPLASIEPNNEDGESKMHDVRYEGGIEDTQFGLDLLHANLWFKKLEEGLIPREILELFGIRSYQDLSDEAFKKRNDDCRIISEFWYTITPSITVKKNSVGIKSMKEEVFTRVRAVEKNGMSINFFSTMRDPAAEKFAESVNKNFEELSLNFPILFRLQGLFEMVAITKGIEEMDKSPDLSFWLRRYQVKTVKTPKEINVLESLEGYEVRQPQGLFKKNPIYPVNNAISSKFRDGDITALKEAVLESRLSPDLMIWRFLVDEPVIKRVYKEEGMQMTEISLPPEYIGKVVSGSKGKVYSIDKDDNTESQIADIEVISITDNTAYARKTKGSSTITVQVGDFVRFFWENTNSGKMDAMQYYNIGLEYIKKGDFSGAITAWEKALEIEPTMINAYEKLGKVYYTQGRFDKAEEIYRKERELKPDNPMIYSNLGVIYRMNERFEDAVKMQMKALSLDPRLASAYIELGLTYCNQKMLDEAIAAHKKALELNPELGTAHNYLGVVYLLKGMSAEAEEEFNKYKIFEAKNRNE